MFASQNETNEIQKYINNQDNLFFLENYEINCIKCSRKIIFFDTKFRCENCISSNPDFSNKYLKSYDGKYVFSFMKIESFSFFESRSFLLNHLLEFLSTQYPSIHKYILLENEKSEIGFYPLNYFMEISGTNEKEINNKINYKIRHAKKIFESFGGKLFFVANYWFCELKEQKSFIIRNYEDTTPIVKKKY